MHITRDTVNAAMNQGRVTAHTPQGVFTLIGHGPDWELGKTLSSHIAHLPYPTIERLEEEA